MIVKQNMLLVDTMNEFHDHMSVVRSIMPDQSIKNNDRSANVELLLCKDQLLDEALIKNEHCSSSSYEIMAAFLSREVPDRARMKTMRH